MKLFVPPIKSQGIKTKLVEWISYNCEDLNYNRWVEPFMGTGVVAFNIKPKKALLCDSNPHIIKFYNSLKNKEITSPIVHDFLTTEGEKLLNSDGDYYYEVRERFNSKHSSLDFLFLSRSCFNGMMRFNKKGGYNVPFCKKPNRFAKALVTKISNQVEYISQIIQHGDYTFKLQDFENTVKELKSNDLVYADPPYIGRHVDYFDSWSADNEFLLKAGLVNSNTKFILSTWLSNKYRTNNYIFEIWKDCFISTKEHFYHVGGKESNRNAVYEALLSNVELKECIHVTEMKSRIKMNKPQLTGISKENKLPTPCTLALNVAK